MKIDLTGCFFGRTQRNWKLFSFESKNHSFSFFFPSFSPFISQPNSQSNMTGSGEYNPGANLEFSTKFYGRQEELKLLRTVFERVCVPVDENNKPRTSSILSQANRESQFVLLGGYSGTGKSALVKKFVQEVEQSYNKIHCTSTGNRTQHATKPCYFLRGKFDENQTAVVFSALVEAFNGFLTDLISSNDTAELNRVRDGIRRDVKDEGGALMALFPDLSQLMGESGSTASISRATQLASESKENAWNRLAYAFKCFVRVISTEQRPIIIFLDDLQWADDSSLDLITDLLMTKSIQSVMLIGAFRSNEVHDGHPLTKKLNLIEKSISIERINLENLSLDKIAEFIAHTLNLDVEEVDSLAEVVHKKTQGNIFFAMQTLEQLRRKQVLYVSIDTFKWAWDENRAASESSISDNVVDLVTAKIQILPENVQEALTIASFLRSTFDTAVLAALMEREKCGVRDTDELIPVLDIAADEGLLEAVSNKSDSYRFTHDRIRQAAYSIIPEGEDLEHMRMRIGKHLLELSSTAIGADWMLFVAADHLNSIPDPGLDPLELVRLNLKAGEQAIEISAFLPASTYLSRALQEIEKVADPWETHYALSLQLYRSAAEVEICLGNFETGSSLSQVISEKVDDVLDKLPTLVSVADGLGRLERHAEALELNMKCLDMLKCFPRKNHLFNAVRSLVKVKKLLKKHSNYDIMLLPMMTDENKLHAMVIISQMALRAYHCSNMPVVLLCILRQITLTFDYGLCPDSCVGFASYGFLLSGTFGDQEGGNRMARLSKDLLQAQGGGMVTSFVLFTVSAYIDAWAVPIPQLLETFQKSHKSGMEYGDLENVSKARH